MPKKFLLIVLSFFSFSFVFASGRNLPGVKIITREQWGANSQYLFRDYKDYQKLILQQKHLNELIQKYPQKYQSIIEKRKRNKIRQEYLNKNWKNDVTADKYLCQINGKKLWWCLYYKFNKTKIIIHHTDADYRKFPTQDKVEKYIRGIYYYHAIQRGWGDIGYNFLIDQFGNIYEGRYGGEGVVGANSTWNNVPSIGIALIGDFNIEKPTQAQLNALIKLLDALVVKYNIDPKKVVTYHENSNKYPYIKNVKAFALAGHKDTGHTACPGKYLYALLPSIRDKVYKYWLKYHNKSYKLVNTKALLKKSITYKPKFSFDDTIKLKFDNIQSCKSLTSGIQINCDNNFVTIKDVNINGKIIKNVKFNLKTDKIDYSINFKAVFLDEVRFLVKKELEKKYSKYFTKYKTRKIQYKVSLLDVKSFQSKPVKVLLYQLSFFKHYDFKCSKTCLIYTDKGQYSAKVFSVDKVNPLILWINNKAYDAKWIKIDSLGGFIKFTNYNRKSYSGIPWNFFRGKILIKKDYIKPIGQAVKYQYVVINELSISDYLKGIAEGNDQMPLEKLKVMALLAKDYLYFYFNGKNKHPSIPYNASYNAIDDPRIYQKYVGAGFEATSKLWPKALQATKNQVIIYDNYIPILPYFSCSAGFTYSARQKFGRIDTPYLTNNFDFGKCANGKFAGHGVGLSGKGAEILAKKGLNYKQILKWYFRDVKVVGIEK